MKAIIEHSTSPDKHRKLEAEVKNLVMEKDQMHQEKELQRQLLC